MDFLSFHRRHPELVVRNVVAGGQKGETLECEKSKHPYCANADDDSPRQQARCLLPVHQQQSLLSLGVDGGCRLRTTKRKDARTFVVEQQKMHADHNLFGLF